MTARELLYQATSLLERAGCDSPRLDAELILMHVWQISRTELFIRLPEAVPDKVQLAFSELLKRRQQREPVAYILGQKEFWSRSFVVNRHVLIPRPETEHLIEELIRRFPDRERPYHFCDIGTGSGIIACTLACEYPNSTVVATDLSNEALTVAGINAERLGVSPRIDFRHGDMFESIVGEPVRFDAILSNPPYVAADEMDLLEAELSYEPDMALTDGSDGMRFLRIILDSSRKWLVPGGYLLVETGICGLPETPVHLEYIDCFSDLAGIIRGGIYRLAAS